MSAPSEATAPVNSPAATAAAAAQPHPEQQPYATHSPREVDSSLPPPYQSIPPGAVPVIIHHVANTESRKRGRPRKFKHDVAVPISMAPPPHTPIPQPDIPVQMDAQSPAVVSTSHTAKRARGRPPGSRNKNHPNESLGSTEVEFMPQVLIVNEGEDISSKIMHMSQNGPGALCVMSASGIVSTVMLGQPAASGGTATYEGRFDIVSLSGSFLLSEVSGSGQRRRMGGLSISLSGPNGRIFGGSVAGLLMAASPVRVLLGSFTPDGYSDIRPNHVEPLLAARHVNMGGASGPSNSTSRGTFGGSSGGLASPLNLSSGACENTPQGMVGH